MTETIPDDPEDALAGDDIDRRWLGNILASHHLRPDAMAQYHTRYATSGAKVLILDDFLVAPVANRLADFLLHEADFEVRFGLYKENPADGTLKEPVTEQEWRAVPDERRFFKFGVGPMHDRQITPGLVRYKFFQASFSDRRIRRYLETICGAALGPVSSFLAHAMDVGDMLRPHSDVLENRKIAFLFYLNPNWNSDFGGALQIRESSGDTTVIEPLFNRFALFDVTAHAEHWVSAVSAAADGNRRLSIGGWIDDAPDPLPDRESL